MSTIREAGPYVFYPDGAAALDWLGRVFGFQEVARWVDDTGEVQEAETRAGPMTVMVGAGRAAKEGEGAGQLFIIVVDDVEAMHRRVTAASLKAAAPKEKPWGPRTFAVKDPWGYTWDFWQRVKPFVDGTGGLREIRAATHLAKGE